MPVSSRSGAPAERDEAFLVPPIAQPVADGLLRAADRLAGGRVVDVACGTGVVTRAPGGPVVVATAPVEARDALEKRVVEARTPHAVDGRVAVEGPMVLAQAARP